MSSSWFNQEKLYKNKPNLKLTDNIPHPVGIKARILAKRSGIESGVKATTRHTAATRPIDTTPCKNLNTSWKSADFFGL